MPIDPRQLPDDPEILRKIVVDLTVQLESGHKRLAKVERLLEQLLEAKTGRRSEKLSPDQLALFEAELKAQGLETAGLETAPVSTTDADDDDTDDGKAGGGADGERQSKRTGRRPLPPHLKRERIVHDLADQEKHCRECDQGLRAIGEETSERYEFIPAQLLVVEEVCLKYACGCTIRTATKPSQPIEKSTAGASLLAAVIVAKHADHLPVHRQVKMFRRSGVEFSDQTLCGWMGQSADLLQPLYERLKRFVLSSVVVGTDDTPVKVLDRAWNKTRRGRIWPYRGDRDHPAVVFDYTPTRERAGPQKFLAGYRGPYLQADAYAVYDRFFNDPQRGLLENGCMSHARRHFRDALSSDRARMSVVLALIAQLYRVESMARKTNLDVEQVRLAREHGARPVLNQMHGYLLRIREEVLPKSEAAQAIGYALNHWTALTRYCDDGRLAIDNNATERALRGFAIGRNNWMFFGSDRGGRIAAVLRSFVVSCELVKADPFAWFRDVLRRIGEHPLSKLDELLPHRWAEAQQPAR